MFGTFGKSLHVSLELGVACFLRRNWLFVLAQQTLEVLINGLSLRLRAISQDFRSLLIYLKCSAHLRRSNRELLGHHSHLEAAWQRSMRFGFSLPRLCRPMCGRPPA